MTVFWRKISLLNKENLTNQSREFVAFFISGREYWLQANKNGRDMDKLPVFWCENIPYWIRKNLTNHGWFRRFFHLLFASTDPPANKNGQGIK